MDFHEAVTLARDVRDRQPTLRVITIGHFIPFDEMPSVEPPWKIAVMIEGCDRPRVVASRDELESLVRKPDPPKAMEPRKPREPEAMLF